MTIAITTTAAGVRLPVKVVPGATRDRVVGPLGAALKVQVTAPPEKGKANEAVCGLLAAALGVPKHRVRIDAGASNAHKTIEVLGVTAADVRERLGFPGSH